MRADRLAGGSAPNVIGILSTIGFFGIFSTTISKSPVLPLFVGSMGAGAEVIGLISAISPLAGILFSFPVGLLADRIGRKRLLVIAALVFVSAPALYVLVRNPYWLIPIRFFHGIGTAILGPVSSAVILSRYRESKGENLGIYSSATLVGRSLAPLLGGAIISLFINLPQGWNYRLVYAGAFLLSLPVLVLVLGLPSDSRTPVSRTDGEGGSAPTVKPPSHRDFGSSLGLFLSNRRLLGTALVEMATYFAYGGLETFLPMALKARGMPDYQIGAIFSVMVLSIALTKPLFGKLSDNIDRRIQVLAGITILGLSFGLIPLANGIIPATALSLVFGLGLSFSTVATSTYVSDVAAEEELGSSLGALSSIMDIGHSSGPLIIGLVVQAATLRAGFLSGLGVCMASALLFASATFIGSRPRKSS